MAEDIPSSTGYCNEKDVCDSTQTDLKIDSEVRLNNPLVVEMGVTDQNVSVTSSDRTKESKDSVDHANLHYEGDTCIYTDPESKYQYVWSKAKSEWQPRINATTSENSENVKSVTISSVDSETKTENVPEEMSMAPGNDAVLNKDYKFDGETYLYTDSQTGLTYKYDNATSKWLVKETKVEDAKLSKDGGSAESESEEEEDEGSKVIRQDMSSGHYSFEGDTHIYTDATDGTVYEWDKEKNAWFPKKDEW